MSGIVTSHEPRPKMNPGQLLALSFLWFPINLFWTAMLQFLLPQRVQEMVGEASKGEALGIISFIGAIATTVIQLVIAPVSDNSRSRFGRRHPFVVIGVVIGILFMVMFALVRNFPLLIVSFVGIQLFLNIANGPYQALMPDNIDDSQEGIASAYMGGALLLGQLVAAVLFIVFGQSLPDVGKMIFMSALLAIGTLVTVFGVRDRPATEAEKVPMGAAIRDLFDWRIRENPDFYTLLSSRFCINLAYFTVVEFLLYYLQDAIGLGKEKAAPFMGYILLAVTLSALVGTIVAGLVLRYVTKKQVVYATCVLLILSALVFTFTGDQLYVLIIAGVFGLGWGAFQAVDWALAVNLLPTGGAAKYMAIWHICMTVPQIIAPLFGKIADILNAQYGASMGAGVGWRAAMLSTVVYLVLGTVLLRPVRERLTSELKTNAGREDALPAE
ncbi:MAG: MFS transporter [Capsulimonadales bacterium]|nr:MFS transporter [Capsulimonadales bacterium]